MQTSFFEHTQKAWQTDWQCFRFRRQFLAGWSLVIGLLCFLPFYYPHIEYREGILLKDWLLEQLPAQDVSIPIFLIIWGSGLLTIIRAVSKPTLMVHVVWGYAFVTIFRLITIWFIPLNPPIGLIPLIDPLSNIFYGDVKFATKDLFFSGHTSTLFLFYLALEKKSDKWLSLVGVVILGCLLAIQHVHYTIDILFAPFGTYLAYRLAKNFVPVPQKKPNLQSTDA